MQGLITLDFGNTNPHAGLFQKHGTTWNLIKVVPFAELSLYLSQLQMTPDNSSIVLSEVKPREEELTPFLNQGFLLTRVKEYWRGTRFAGMPVSYGKTLGEDRLIAAFYAFKKLKENVLIIDAGTYLTMDVVTNAGFLGGYIIPGFQVYLSQYSKGEQLKDVDLAGDISTALPQATQDAMRNSYSAFAALAQKLIKDHGLQKVLITGGNGGVWKKVFDELGLSAIVQEEPALIHSALQFWMTTQIEPL